MSGAAPGAAQALPQAGVAVLRGRYRRRPEDFRVDEVLGFAPAGAGEHVLVQVRKRGANTAWVGAEVARRAEVPVADVSWCGEKDRHAVTTQWFSVRDPGGAFAPAAGEGGDGWEVLASARHVRKLRRGDHAGNRFRLRVHPDEGDATALAAPVAARLVEPVPNYFGPQRFGRDGANLAAAAAWVRGGRLPPRGASRGRILSAARAQLFNLVLAARVRAGTAATVLEGDVAEAGLPTGPLWGRGRSPVTGAAALVEAAALADHGAWCERLEHAGLEQARRPLVLRLASPEVTSDDEALELAFELPPGAFATAVLAALGPLRDAAAPAPEHGGSPP
ncbi:MAG: tRNA pseudouridine(13) synthase TruD [Pseudomonadales bacterium]|nr:tRNA pseudouridine(13) synthase TruD [Pseudomonadales bacterium]